MRRKTIERLFLLLIVVVSITIPVAAADVRWVNKITLYADNTEFGSDYRDGETILGGWLKSYAEVKVGERSTFQLGAYGNARSAIDDDSQNDADAIISFRYRTKRSQFILGSLETSNRHGLIEPLEVTTLELTRPHEMGLQILSNHRWLVSDFFISWQKLNTAEHREVFDYGWVARVPLASWLDVEGQVHGLHHGGQLFDVGRVYNNLVYGPGVRARHVIPFAGNVELSAFYLESETTRDPEFRDRPTQGDGIYVKASARPAERFETFAIWWKGDGFFSAEGDFNYSSTGVRREVFRSDRDYKEVGVGYTFPTETGPSFRGEFRLHKIDDRSLEPSLRILASVELDAFIGRVNVRGKSPARP